MSIKVHPGGAYHGVASNPGDGAPDAVHRPVPFIKVIASAIVSILIAPSVAGPTGPGGFAPATPTEALQTKALHDRLESLRNSTLRITLAFTGLHQTFAVSHTSATLRRDGCSYEISKDTSGLIDILLGANIRVGYPTGWERYQPEARFGVYFGADSAEGIDLWFSNPLTFTPPDQLVLGEGHDRRERTAYKIAAAPTLRGALWDWARTQGTVRPGSDAACREIEKFDPPQTSSRE